MRKPRLEVAQACEKDGRVVDSKLGRCRSRAREVCCCRRKPPLSSGRSLFPTRLGTWNFMSFLKLLLCPRSGWRPHERSIHLRVLTSECLSTQTYDDWRRSGTLGFSTIATSFGNDCPWARAYNATTFQVLACILCSFSPCSSLGFLFVVENNRPWSDWIGWFTSSILDWNRVGYFKLQYFHTYFQHGFLRQGLKPFHVLE